MASDTPGVPRANFTLRELPAHVEALLAAGRAESVLLQRAPVINTLSMHARSSVAAEPAPGDLRIEAAPTVNNDNTVTVQITARAGERSTKTLINTRGDEVFAVLLPPGEAGDRPESTRIMVALISARIVRTNAA